MNHLQRNDIDKHVDTDEFAHTTDRLVIKLSLDSAIAWHLLSVQSTRRAR